MLQNLLGKNKKTNHKILRSIDENIQTIIFYDTEINPLSSQGIKIFGKVYKLIFFEKSSSNLTYEFEKNVILKFYFKDGVTIYCIKNPQTKLHDVKVWDNKYSKNWSSISWNNISKELDFINVLAYENGLK
jgi:hypothetical protein